MEQRVQEPSIKEFKLESEEFNSRAEKFKLIFNASPDMIFILSHTGLILDANDAALVAYEYKHDQIFGMSYEKLLTKNAHVKNARKLFDSVNNGAEIDYEWITQTQTGRKISVDIRLRSLKLSDDEEKSAVVLILRDISSKQKADEAIKSLTRATNINEFEGFLKESVRSLAQLYGTKFVFIGRLLPGEKSVSTLSVWAGDQFVDNFTYGLADTPCKDVVDMKSAFISENACELYPEDKLLADMGVQSYFGVSMVAERKKMGLLVLMDDKPLVVEEWAEPILGLFANRLAAEIERFEATQELKQNQEHLEELVKERTKTIEEQTNTIKQKNLELEEANKEMKSFCYSVSHDLRAPLRGISGFSDVIMEDYKDKLNEEGVDYLNRIKNSTVNMASLIDGMLQLSRVSHHSKGEVEEVSLSLIAEETMMTLSSIDKDRNVDIKIQADLVVMAERDLMIILLQNLLGNAWKYTSKSEAVKIEFFKAEIKGREVFVVKDNGAGFDMNYIEMLFEPFKRLHGDSEFLGSGIGLATVKKIIDLHGGKIWAESPVDSSTQSGAAFYFIL